MRPLLLPDPDGALRPYRPQGPSSWPGHGTPPRCRRAFAAAHVVGDPWRSDAGGGRAQLDWEATLAYRRHLWSLGLSVAEAMDTAQRGMGLDWPVSRELIRRSALEARAVAGGLACGAGTDQLAGPPTVERVVDAYLEQCAFVESQGAQVIVMASRALAACARDAEDYMRAYDHVLGQVSRPVILHWLGEAFDPALGGYWGAQAPDLAMRTCLQIVRDHPGKVDGIKLSLLDVDLEVRLRRLLPAGVRLYTGDDFHYPELIAGDQEGYSDALLGVFDAIAPAAAAALAALDAGQVPRFRALLEPTLPLARQLFAAPTFHYKTGIVFLAYINGHQAHFRMVGGMESARSILHLSQLFQLADAAGLLLDPEVASARMARVLALAGVETG